MLFSIISIISYSHRSSSRQSVTGSIQPTLSRSNSVRSRYDKKTPQVFSEFLFRKQSTSSFSSCSNASSIPRCNSAGSQTTRPAAPVRKVSSAKTRRQSSLAAIQSDQEALSSSCETLHQVKNTRAGERRVQAGQEKEGNNSRNRVRGAVSNNNSSSARKPQRKSNGK